MVDVIDTVTSANGKEYKLYIKDGELGYRWHGDGKTPSLISGYFTDIISARVAMKKWLDSKEEQANKPSRLEELKNCKTNEELKSFCEKYNLATPDTTNLNGRKKILKEKLLAQGDKE